MKNKVLKMLANTSKKVAISSSESASWFMIHQPVEPKELKALREKEQSKL